MVKYKDDNNAEVSFSTKITEITLAELPYTDLLEFKKIKESTVLWYAAAGNEKA